MTAEKLCTELLSVIGIAIAMRVNAIFFVPRTLPTSSGESETAASNVSGRKSSLVAMRYIIPQATPTVRPRAAYAATIWSAYPCFTAYPAKRSPRASLPVASMTSDTAVGTMC